MGIFFVTFLFQIFAQSPQAFRTLQKLDPEFFWKEQKFTFQNSLRDWTLQALQQDPANFKKIYRFKKEPKDSGFLQIEFQNLKTPMDFHSSSKKWIKDFAQLGFQVLQAKNQKSDSSELFIGDLLDPKTNKQSRFILMMKGKQIVTLTCSEDAKNFLVFLDDCQKKIKNFRWTSSQDFSSIVF